MIAWSPVLRMLAYSRIGVFFTVPSFVAIKDGTEIMLITNEGIIIRIDVDDISQLGRVTSGVKLMNLDL